MGITTQQEVYSTTLEWTILILHQYIIVPEACNVRICLLMGQEESILVCGSAPAALQRWQEPGDSDDLFL